MKRNIRLLFASAITASMFLSACVKDPANNPGNNNNNDLGTHSDDQARFSADNDDVVNEANEWIGEYPAFNGRPGGTAVLPCNSVAVMDSTTTLRRITVTYNGNNCRNSHRRTGVVVLTMPLATRWVDAGAVLTVNIQNLRITRLSDNKSIVLNGVETVTNTTGGHIWQLANLGQNIIHDIASSGMSITFDNGQQRVWQVAKRRTFSYNNGIVVTTEGTHTQNGVSNISEWGTNRFGNAFTTSITSPIIIRQDCSFRVVSGQVTHNGLSATMVTTFGLDSTGAVQTSCPSGFYYFKTVWTGTNGAVVTVIYPY